VSAELPPLPSRFDDGGDWMNDLRHGRRAVPAWGRDGWDLAEWPYAVVAHCDCDGLYGLATYQEGDVEVQSFVSRAERDAHTDRIAAGYWRANGRGPRGLPDSDDELAPHQRGPFSLALAEREGHR
jgi:hypothetical protein